MIVLTQHRVFLSQVVPEDANTVRYPPPPDCTPAKFA